MFKNVNTFNPNAEYHPTGKQLESYYFKSIKAPEEKPKKYITEEMAMESVKKNQPWEKQSEISNFIGDVRQQIKKSLSIENDENDIKFYTSIDSYLDKFYGIDGFFEITIPESNGKKETVSIDITANKQKGESYKAEIIFLIDKELEKELDKEEYNERVWQLAKQVMDIALMKYEDDIAKQEFEKNEIIKKNIIIQNFGGRKNAKNH